MWSFMETSNHCWSDKVETWSTDFTLRALTYMNQVSLKKMIPVLSTSEGCPKTKLEPNHHLWKWSVNYKAALKSRGFDRGNDQDSCTPDCFWKIGWFGSQPRQSILLLIFKLCQITIITLMKAQEKLNKCRYNFRCFVKN